MKQKYTNNIAYFYKKRVVDKVPQPEEKGVIFQCNIETKTRSILNPMSNQYTTVAEEVIKTTYQLDFEQFDYITFKKYPINDVNSQDFSIIKSAIAIPYMEKGNKYRTIDYKEWTIRVS